MPTALNTGRAINHEDLRQRIAVAVGFGPAIAKLDLLTSGKTSTRLLGLLDQGPGILPAKAERRHRRLGADQPHHSAVDKLERLSVDN